MQEFLSVSLIIASMEYFPSPSSSSATATAAFPPVPAPAASPGRRNQQFSSAIPPTERVLSSREEEQREEQGDEEREEYQEKIQRGRLLQSQQREAEREDSNQFHRASLLSDASMNKIISHHQQKQQPHQPQEKVPEGKSKNRRKRWLEDSSEED